MSRRMLGIGVDIAHVPRFVRMLRLRGPQFLQRAYHPDEIARVEELRALQSQQDARPEHTEDVPSSNRLGHFLASRWAAKEAMHKALATERLRFDEMCVVGGGAAADGAARKRAELRFFGKARDTVAQAGVSHVHLSLSHDQDYAVAYVVLECEE